MKKEAKAALKESIPLPPVQGQSWHMDGASTEKFIRGQSCQRDFKIWKGKPSKKNPTLCEIRLEGSAEFGMSS